MKFTRAKSRLKSSSTFIPLLISLLLYSKDSYASYNMHSAGIDLPSNIKTFVKRNQVKNPKMKDFIDSIDTMVNKRYRYESDIRAFQKRDYWASPREMESKGTGDCEDYAILKKRILDWVGIESYLVYFKQKGEGHMITVVKLDGKPYALDNMPRKSKWLTKMDMRGMVSLQPVFNNVYGHSMSEIIRNKKDTISGVKPLTFMFPNLSEDT